jgi:hypothetical protein
MGHFAGFFKGADTFLTPMLRTIGGQKVIGPLKKPQETPYYVFCPRQKNNVHDFQNQRYIGIFMSQRARERERERWGEEERDREREQEQEQERQRAAGGWGRPETIRPAQNRRRQPCLFHRLASQTSPAGGPNVGPPTIWAMFRDEDALFTAPGLHCNLKGQSNEIFRLQFFSLNGLSWFQSTYLKAISNFVKFSWSYLYLKYQNIDFTDSGESKIQPEATHIFDSFKMFLESSALHV